MGFWSLFHGVLWIVCILSAGFLAITIVGCCLVPLVYVAVIVMDCMSSVMLWVWEHVIPNNRESPSHRLEPEPPPPPPVWIEKGVDHE